MTFIAFLYIVRKFLNFLTKMYTHTHTHTEGERETQSSQSYGNDLLTYPC